MLILTTRSHITCSKKGAIVRVMGVVKVFEFEIWGRFKVRHLQTKLKEKKTKTKHKFCTNTNVHNKPMKAKRNPIEL
jgi:hypothetical protein